LPETEPDTETESLRYTKTKTDTETKSLEFTDTGTNADNDSDIDYFRSLVSDITCSGSFLKALFSAEVSS
jgi:hypothetical protein